MSLSLVIQFHLLLRGPTILCYKHNVKKEVSARYLSIEYHAVYLISWFHVLSTPTRPSPLPRVTLLTLTI